MKRNSYFTLLCFCFRKPEINLDYTLPRKTSLAPDSNKTFCMTGHYTSSQDEFLQLTGRWFLGNLLLFNGNACVCLFTSNHSSLVCIIWARSYSKHQKVAGWVILMKPSRISFNYIKVSLKTERTYILIRFF